MFLLNKKKPALYMCVLRKILTFYFFFESKKTMFTAEFYCQRLTYLLNKLQNNPKVTSIHHALEQTSTSSTAPLIHHLIENRISKKFIKEVTKLLYNKELLISFWLEKYLSEIWKSSGTFIMQQIPIYTVVADTELYSCSVFEPSSNDWIGFYDSNSVIHLEELKQKSMIHKFKTQLFGLRLLKISHEFTIEDALTKLEWLWFENENTTPKVFIQKSSLDYLLEIIATYFNNEFEGVFCTLPLLNASYPPFIIFKDNMSLIKSITCEK